MARRLTTQQRIKRARAEGFSRKQLASAFGVSVSTIGRAERGAKRTTIEAQAAQFYKLGKRAKQSVVSGRASLPSAKPRRVKEVFSPVVSPLVRAEGQLSQMGDSKVVVHITSKTTGQSRTLFARGGIDADDIAGDLRRAVESQTERQYHAGGGVDWDDVTDITIEEY